MCARRKRFFSPLLPPPPQQNCILAALGGARSALGASFPDGPGPDSSARLWPAHAILGTAWDCFCILPETEGEKKQQKNYGATDTLPSSRCADNNPVGFYEPLSEEATSIRVTHPPAGLSLSALSHRLCVGLWM